MKQIATKGSNPALRNTLKKMSTVLLVPGTSCVNSYTSECVLDNSH